MNRRLRAIAVVLLCTPLVTVPAAAAAQSAPAALEVGKPITRELKGGEVHAYAVQLEAGQYARVSVDQEGIDILVAVFGPDGAKVEEVDGFNGALGFEPVYFLAAAAGTFRVEVQSLDAAARPGRYEIKLVALRAATNEDRLLPEAKALSANAVALLDAGKLREALPIAEQAATAFEKAFGSDSPNRADSLNLLATICRESGDGSPNTGDTATRRGVADALSGCTVEGAGRGASST